MSFNKDFLNIFDAVYYITKKPRKVIKDNTILEGIWKIFGGKIQKYNNYYPSVGDIKEKFDEIYDIEELRPLLLNTVMHTSRQSFTEENRKKIFLTYPPIFSKIYNEKHPILFHSSVDLNNIYNIYLAEKKEGKNNAKEILEDIVKLYDKYKVNNLPYDTYYPLIKFFMKNSRKLKKNVLFMKNIFYNVNYTEKQILGIFKYFEVQVEYFLHLAMAKGYKELAKYMIENNYNAYYDKNFTLSVAAYSGFRKVVRILLNKGAKINYNGGLPLRFALYGGHEKLARFLIENGADVTVNNNEPILIAKDKCPDLVELIRAKGGEHEKFEKW